MDLNLKGKIALVTGGSHGIGQAICVSLAQEGCNIAFCARGKRYDLNDTVKLVNETGNSCLPLKVDINNASSANSVVADTLVTYGRIDILINNIGGGSSWGNIQQWEKTSQGVWEETVMHNYLTSVWFTNALIPHMVNQKFGRIISISSMYGKESGGVPWFSAAKAAQLTLMKNYANNSNFVSHGLTFNTVCPGFTDIKDKGTPFISDEIANIPMHRYATSDEISPMVTFLCSDRAAYINGSTIVIDGGFSKSF